jgi:hypothetical protein
LKRVSKHEDRYRAGGDGGGAARSVLKAEEEREAVRAASRRIGAFPAQRGDG